MKHKITEWLWLGILMLCVSTNICSQGRIAVQPGFNSFGGEMQLLPDHTIRVIGIASDDWWYGMSFVSTVHFNTAGKQLSVRMFPELSLEDAWDLHTLPTRDGHTIVVAALTGCDYGVPVTPGRISPSDTIVWYGSSNYSEVYGTSFSLRQVTDTIFRIWDSYDSEFYSLGGIPVTKPQEYVLYNDILLTTNGFIMSKDSALVLCDPDFTPLKSKILHDQIVAFDTSAGNGVFCATTDSLYVLDAVLDIILSEPLPVTIASSVFTTRAYFWVVESSTNQFYQLDTQLNVIGSFQLDPRVEVRDILHLGDTIFISGNFTGRDQSMVLFRTRQDNFSLDLPTDIGITDIRRTEQATSINIDWGWGWYPVRNVYYGPTYVTLHNYGSTVIHETFVRFQEYACPSFCQGVLQYEWHLTGLFIPPGESQEVYLDDLSFNCTAYAIEQLCLYTINPNGEPDVHFENDAHCVTVDVISDVADVSNTADVIVYPNPASEVLHIEYSDDALPFGEMALFDNTGHTVWQNHFDHPVTAIGLKDILPGVYFLVIQIGSDRPMMRRIVVM